MAGVQLLHWTIVAADVTAGSDELRVRRDSIHINKLQIDRMLRPSRGVAGSRMHNLKTPSDATACCSFCSGSLVNRQELPQPSLITVRCVAGVLVIACRPLPFSELMIDCMHGTAWATCMQARVPASSIAVAE